MSYQIYVVNFSSTCSDFGCRASDILRFCDFEVTLWCLNGKHVAQELHVY